MTEEESTTDWPLKYYLTAAMLAALTIALSLTLGTGLIVATGIPGPGKMASIFVFVMLMIIGVKLAPRTGFATLTATLVFLFVVPIYLGYLGAGSSSPQGQILGLLITSLPAGVTVDLILVVGRRSRWAHLIAGSVGAVVSFLSSYAAGYALRVNLGLPYTGESVPWLLWFTAGQAIMGALAAWVGVTIFDKRLSRPVAVKQLAQCTSKPSDQASTARETAKRFIKKFFKFLIYSIFGGIGAVAVAYLLFGLSTLFCYLSPSCRGRTDSLEKVHFEINGRHLFIPKAYLDESANWSGGRRRGISLEAILPKLEPYNRDTKKEFDRSGWGREVLIFIHELEPVATPITDEIYYRNVMKDLVENTEKEGPSGLTVYRYKDERRNDDIYISKSENKINIKFLCSNISDSTRSPACKRYIYFDDIYISYSYSREYLENWDEIHTKLLRLIDSFKAEEKEIP